MQYKMLCVLGKLAGAELALKGLGGSYWDDVHWEMLHRIPGIAISSSYLDLSWLPITLLLNLLNSASYEFIYVNNTLWFYFSFFLFFVILRFS